jgi:hypothetical protein
VSAGRHAVDVWEQKNWLFVASDDGAKWNATFVSMIAS